MVQATGTQANVWTQVHGWPDFLQPVLEDGLCWITGLRNDPGTAAPHEWHGWRDPHGAYPGRSGARASCHCLAGAADGAYPEHRNRMPLPVAHALRLRSGLSAVSCCLPSSQTARSAIGRGLVCRAHVGLGSLARDHGTVQANQVTSSVSWPHRSQEWNWTVSVRTAMALASLQAGSPGGRHSEAHSACTSERLPA